ncbi:MAG: hypothetical protein SF182_25630 [Deltaproteobacteria bacterium]|nr:hypothetical protein [Deltaproteobacteria bacterium]
MRVRVLGLAAALLLLASGAFAHVIDPAVDKTNYKLRADIAKQVSKYTFCLVKAATGCEKKGANSGPECDLATGAISFADPSGKVQPKFVAAIQKCDTKINLSKKGTDYMGIGCPGDCNTGAPGAQPCATMAAWQATVTGTGTGSAKAQLGLLSGGIDLACGITLGGANTDQARIDCAEDNAKALSKYAQGLFKCEQKCELDVKAKIGNGGLTNGNECQVDKPGVDPAFATCASAALTKAAIPDANVVAVVLPLLKTAVNDATAGLFNRFDPTGADDATPCGTCGDNLRAGAEECDGTSDAACPGSCATDCTCP